MECFQFAMKMQEVHSLVCDTVSSFEITLWSAEVCHCVEAMLCGDLFITRQASDEGLRKANRACDCFIVVFVNRQITRGLSDQDFSKQLPLEFEKNRTKKVSLKEISTTRRRITTDFVQYRPLYIIKVYSILDPFSDYQFGVTMGAKNASDSDRQLR